MDDMVSIDSTELVPTRELQRRITRQRIVAAARRVFEQNGYAGSTIGEITKASGVNRATFYLHFANKAEVFNDVYDSVSAHETVGYWELLGAALAEGTATSLRKCLNHSLVWWESHAALLPAIHEAMASDLDVAGRWKQHLDTLAEALQEYLAGFPEERREHQRLRVEMLVVLLDQMCFRVLVQKVFPISRDELLEVVTALWVDSLGLSTQEHLPGSARRSTDGHVVA